MAKRMSKTERLFREAVCPQTLPEDVGNVEDEETGRISWADRLLLDGTASIRRISVAKAPETVKRLSAVGKSLRLSSSSMDGDATGRTSSAARVPPPPPPPIQTLEASRALQEAQLRRSQRLSEVTGVTLGKEEFL